MHLKKHLRKRSRSKTSVSNRSATLYKRLQMPQKTQGPPQRYDTYI